MISPEWRELRLWTAILPEEAQRLRELAAGRKVLEVGAAHGYSAIVMALAGAKISSIDTHEGTTWLGDTLTAMRNNLIAFGVSDRVAILQGKSEAIMPQLVAAGDHFDFIFLDGGATYEENCWDLHWAMKLVEDYATIARHDYGHKDYPDNKKAFDELFPLQTHKLTGSLVEVNFYKPT
jgi:predicted O-methyltransferase YrrM